MVTYQKPARRRRKFWGFGTWILRFALKNQCFCLQNRHKTMQKTQKIASRGRRSAGGIKPIVFG